MADKIRKSDAQWAEQLTPEQYYICRDKGTEAPFSGSYTDCFETGTYVCVCCDSPLFLSTDKFESRCGWPSFSASCDKAALEYTTDESLMMKRTEVTCARCDAHLGHVFDDGAPPDGQRYCINSVSLILNKE